MSEPVGVSGNQLRAIIERIEHVEEEIKALAEDLEALELGMAEVEGLVLSRPVVSGPKGLGSSPGLECGPALPYGVGGIQCVIFGLRTLE
jgi:hypothetical protein